MNPFPAEYELLSFFSQEPQLMYDDIPAFYNMLEFSGRVTDAAYVVRISPSARELEIRAVHSDHLLVHMAVTDVAGLTVHEGAAEAVLIASFPPNSGRGLLKFRLRPRLEIEWPFDKL